MICEVPNGTNHHAAALHHIKTSVVASLRLATKMLMNHVFPYSATIICAIDILQSFRR